MLIQQSLISSATVATGPSAPTNLVMSLQALQTANAGNVIVDPQGYTSPFNPPPYINDTQISWTQGSGGVGGIAKNKVYRSTTSNSSGFSLLYTSTTPITTYFDSAANNCIYYGNSDPNYTGTTYWYKVTAVDASGNESAQSAAQQYDVYANNAYNWGAGFASGVTINYQNTTHLQPGTTYNWSTTVTTQFGYLLPYADCTVAKWNQWNGAFNNFQFDVYTPNNGDFYTVYFVRVGDIYIYGTGGSAAGPTTVYTSSFATLVGGQWNTVVIPLSAMINDYGTSGAGPPVMRYACYKFGFQPQNVSNGFTFLLNNVKFTQ
jgi:hypothetical protein